MKPDNVERHNREAWDTPPASPVPRVFFAEWFSGRPGGYLPAVRSPRGVDVESYDYGVDDPEARRRDRELAEF